MRERERKSASSTPAWAYPAAVALIFFGSGFCALVYQVAWLRLLRLVFGASTAASAAVLAIFMGGLGLGGLLLGRRADRATSPLALYARLELGISAAAAASPLLIALVRAIYVGLGGTIALGPFLGTVLRLALAALVLGLPTFLMGGTLPAVARAVEHRADRGRRLVALLYGTNTLGAVAGALTTTFFALELLGVRTAIFAAAVINGGLALAALRLSRSSLPRSSQEEPRETHAKPKPGRKDAATASAGVSKPRHERALITRFVYLAAAVVGFAFLLMELVWYRMLAPILGGSSYTLGLILAVALIGIGAGGLLYAVGGQHQRPTASAFAATCAVEALFVILPLVLGDRIAILAMVLRPVGDAGFGALAATWALIAAIVVLPAAIVAGYQFPLLVAILGSGERDLGHEIGTTYAWNTAGAIVGSIAGGFGLLPLLSAPRTWQAVSVLLVLLAVATLWVGSRLGDFRRPGRHRALPALACALAASLITAILSARVAYSDAGPSALWRHTPIGAGRMPARFDGPNALRKVVRESRRSMIWEAEGVESSIGLEGDAQYIFLINGKADGSALRDAANMVMSVLVGAALHPQPRYALVIGLGSGQSAGWLAEVPTIEQVDVVELEPAVLEVAERCAPANFDVLQHPKVDTIIGDGRELLLTTDAQYDLIFSQPSNPYRAGIASLFSREFYQATHARLRPGGLLLQWLQGDEVDANLVASAYATIGSVFPSVESWQVHENDLLLVASREPIEHDRDRIDALLATYPFDRALDQVWGVEGTAGLYTGFLAGPAVAADLAAANRYRLNTDDRPRMEFGFVRTLGRAGLFHVAAIGQLARDRRADRPPGFGSEEFWQRTADWQTAREVAWGSHLLEPPAGTAPDRAARIRARSAYREGDLQQALLAWRSQSQPADSPLDRLLVAEASAELSDEQVPEMIDRLGPHRELEGLALRARWHWRRGEAGLAARMLAQLFARARQDPWIYPPVLARALSLAKEIADQQRAHGTALFDLLDESFAVRLLEELRWRTRVEMAGALGDATRCARALVDFEPHAPWEGRFLLNRYRCYAEVSHANTPRAEAELQRFLDDAPPSLERDLLPADTGPGSAGR